MEAGAQARTRCCVVGHRGIGNGDHQVGDVDVLIESAAPFKADGQAAVSTSCPQRIGAMKTMVSTVASAVATDSRVQRDTRAVLASSELATALAVPHTTGAPRRDQVGHVDVRVDDVAVLVHAPDTDSNPTTT